MAVALLMSIVMVITGKELFKISLLWFGFGGFFLGSDPSRVLLFFILINFAAGTESKPITW